MDSRCSRVSQSMGACCLLLPVLLVFLIVSGTTQAAPSSSHVEREGSVLLAGEAETATRASVRGCADVCALGSNCGQSTTCLSDVFGFGVEVCYDSNAACNVRSACEKVACAIQGFTCDAFGVTLGATFPVVASFYKSQCNRRRALNTLEKTALGCHFPASVLNRAQVYFDCPLNNVDFGNGVEFALGVAAGAITFGYDILLYQSQPSSLSAQQRLIELLAHELIHTMQYRKYNDLIGFGAAYMQGFCNAGLSYDDNVFERWAQKFESTFRICSSGTKYVGCLYDRSSSSDVVTPVWSMSAERYVLAARPTCEDDAVLEVERYGAGMTFKHVKSGGYVGISLNMDANTVALTLISGLSAQSTWLRVPNTDFCLQNDQFSSFYLDLQGTSWTIDNNNCDSISFYQLATLTSSSGGLALVGSTGQPALCSSSTGCGPDGSASFSAGAYGAGSTTSPTTSPTTTPERTDPPPSVCIDAAWIDARGLEKVHATDGIGKMLCILGLDRLPCGTPEHVLEVAGSGLRTYAEVCAERECSVKVGHFNGVLHSDAHVLPSQGGHRLTTVAYRGTTWSGVENRIVVAVLKMRLSSVRRALTYLQRRNSAPVSHSV